MDAADGAAGLVEMVNGGRAISAAPPLHKITIYGWSTSTPAALTFSLFRVGLGECRGLMAACVLFPGPPLDRVQPPLIVTAAGDGLRRLRQCDHLNARALMRGW
ncbi:hypothetical protein FNV62_05850 [Streptomyces sp. RLB3-17]|uniref:hypothetical protein n=1 Tax=Streptomyces sp. RLB3-17 TaxID=2594455 RepID=UPI0011650153|nr:hypothetical protein [Streptomyces sp. RLB3-17]QDO37779.1 hypothetical protein FNV62_05850 [Streptomyces sp. RLB3-17]